MKRKFKVLEAFIIGGKKYEAGQDYTGSQAKAVLAKILDGKNKFNRPFVEEIKEETEVKEG